MNTVETLLGKRENAGVSTPAVLLPELIHRETIEGGIALLTFDRPDSSANVFDRDTLLQLRAHLEAIPHEAQLKGLVLASAKPSIFIAGADLHAVAQMTDLAELRELIELGQSVFNQLAGLNIPTLAAIHGACLGGGFEVCLACDYRLASPDRATKLGLPETQLGILPAWGGCTRLPRLIGLPRALALILGGKTLAAKPALKAGLVDELVPRERLLEVARQKLAALTGKPRRRRPLHAALTNNSLGAFLLRHRTRPQLEKKTRGHYPAVFKALDVVTRGISRTIADSLALERDAILSLSQTEACHNLIQIFLLQERAKHLTYGPAFAAGAPSCDPVKNIAVIGAGIMGAGITQWASSREIRVVLRDLNEEAVAGGLARIAQLYEQGVERRLFSRAEARAGLDRITPSAAEVPLALMDLVIEAAVERMDLKQQIFRRLDELAGRHAILATNTSALSISELAGATRHPDRVVGIHFFNPVHRMPLVEVVVGPLTDPAVVQRAVQFVQQLGKMPVVVKDSPGFLVNRILTPYLLEAGHLFESGARVEDIDECMLDFGMPMGPLRLIDEIGVDVANHVADTVAAKFSAHFQKPAVLQQMIEAGWLGKKGGRGFYVHTSVVKEPNVNPHIDRFHHDGSLALLRRDELQDRMVLLMINEAARCLEEGIVAGPADIDFAMIMGAGFAPFLGGPLRLAENLGLNRAVQELETLSTQGELRFRPCDLLATMAREGRRFYEKDSLLRR